MDRMEEKPAAGVDRAQTEQTSDEKYKTSAVGRSLATDGGDQSGTKQTVGGGEHPTTTDRTDPHIPEVDVFSGDRSRLVGSRTGEQRTTGVSWSGDERIADESPIEWETGVECARDWQIVDDRAEAAAQITDEEMLPLLLINDEPRVRDQMVQVPVSRLPSNTKRCVLTMDGYSYVIGGTKAEKITNAITFYICKDNVSFKTVENEGFQHLMQTVCPLYKFPSRNTFRRRVDEIYDVISCKFKESLSKVQHVAVTTDAWTETMQMKSFLGITLHLIEDTKLESRTIGTVELNQSHTAEYIGRILVNTLADWGLEKTNVVAVVTDSGANIKKAIVHQYTADKHVPCVAHTINLVVEKGIEKTQEIDKVTNVKSGGVPVFISKVREIVKFVKRSSKASDLLRKYQNIEVAGPPDTDDPFDGNRDYPVFMDTNEGASSSQDSDQSSRQGALTIVRRSSQKKSTYSEEYSMALSRENESMLDDVDLSLEAMPSFDSSEAVDKAALRLRCLLRHLRKGEISAEVLHKNLFFAAKVLESAFLDEEQISCDMKNSQEEQEEISKTPEPSTSSAVAITSPVVRQKRLRAPIWARRLAAEEDDELSEVQPDAVPQEVRDWLASTFTRQMACTRRKGEEKPKFKSVAHAIRAGIFVDRMYRRVINAPMMTFPPDVIEVLKDINDWSFDVYKLNNYGNGQPLKYLGYDLLNRYGIFQKFKVPSVVMENFLCRIEEGYSRHKNPYHNNLHGADVAQTVHYMLCQTGLMNWLSDLEIFAMLIAAITHDFEHTGTTNNFHVMSGTEIALLYNDRAVLENYHISSTFRILKDEDCNILQNLTKEEFREFRTLVIDMVLATDMSFHFQQLKTMKQLLASPEPTIDKSKAMSMVLHCADISHPAKEWDLHYRWTSQLLEEFFLQGDMEKKLGLPFSPLCDRNNTLIAESQIGFIEFIVEPSMTVCSDMLELILGPINLVNASKTVDTNLVVDENDDKTDNSNQSDVAIACTAMSCSIEDNKDMKENKDVKGSKDVKDTKETQQIESSKDKYDSPSTSKDTKQEEKSDKETKQETNAEDAKSSNKLYKIKKPWNDCLVINKKKWKVQAAREAKLRESKTKYTMRDIRMPLPGEIVQDEDKPSSADVEIVE